MEEIDTYFGKIMKKDHPYFWRLEELNISDINSIISLDPEKSYELWNLNVSNTYDHLMKIPNNWEERKLIRKFKVDTEQLEIGKEIFEKEGICDNTQILFFWSIKYGLKVKGEIFLRHWNQFCYPDDDNVAIVIDNKLLTFVEDVIRVFEN